jgi:hypothetical protein
MKDVSSISHYFFRKNNDNLNFVWYVHKTCPDGGIFDASLSSCAAPGIIICPSEFEITEELP